jgi:hypothetical protein
MKKICLKRKTWQELKDLDPKPSSDSHMLEKDKWHNALRVAPLKIDSKALNHKT